MQRLAWLGHGIGMQLRAAVFGLRHGHLRFAHAGQCAQQGCDFTGFDAVATDLHLIVDPAQENEAAVCQLPDAVAGAVQAFAWQPRVGHKALRGLGRLGLVASRQRQTTDVQLAARALWYAVQLGVQHESLRVVQRMADGELGRVTVAFVRCLREHTNGGFSGAIVVDHAAARTQGLDLVQQAP
ncbi:hypothetical protein AQB9606_04715 [Aquabacterium sp. CECT 9606]|nr:hypothetical protein AQB9606_04715 [Aquabacterium sp. CECT 9606]